MLMDRSLIFGIWWSAAVTELKRPSTGSRFANGSSSKYPDRHKCCRFGHRGVVAGADWVAFHAVPRKYVTSTTRSSSNCVKWAVRLSIEILSGRKLINVSPISISADMQQSLALREVKRRGLRSSDDTDAIANNQSYSEIVTGC